jgi:hypothetical protein
LLPNTTKIKPQTNPQLVCLDATLTSVLGFVRVQGAAAEALTGRQFDRALHSREAMGTLCTFVRAGWTLFTALLMLGSEWVKTHLPKLLQLWVKGVDVVGRQRRSGFEPTHEVSWSVGQLVSWSAGWSVDWLVSFVSWLI